MFTLFKKSNTKSMGVSNTSSTKEDDIMPVPVPAMLAMTSSLVSIEEQLLQLDITNIPLFTITGRYKARYCDIYDGDTLKVIFFFRGTPIKVTCRCMGIDTPEMRPLKNIPNREEHITRAKNAKQFLIDTLNNSRLGIIEIECHGYDKYGRLLIDIYTIDNNNNVNSESVNSLLILNGHAVKYDGGHKTI